MLNRFYTLIAFAILSTFQIRFNIITVYCSIFFFFFYYTPVGHCFPKQHYIHDNYLDAKYIIILVLFEQCQLHSAGPYIPSDDVKSNNR